MVGNEFQQRAVGIAKIDAGAGALGAEALHRPGVDRNAAALEVDDGIPDRPVPLEAQIAVARSDRKPCHLGRVKAGVDVAWQPGSFYDARVAKELPLLRAYVTDRPSARFVKSQC